MKGNHPIAIAARGLVSSIKAQKLEGGPEYRPWEDDLAPAIERLVFAIADEVVERLTAQPEVTDELPGTYQVWRTCPNCNGVGKVSSSMTSWAVTCGRCKGAKQILEEVLVQIRSVSDSGSQDVPWVRRGRLENLPH